MTAKTTTRHCTSCHKPTGIGFRVVEKGGTILAVLANPKSKQIRCASCADALVAKQRKAEGR